MPPDQNHFPVTVHCYSFFKDLAGCSSFVQVTPQDSTLEELLKAVFVRFPKLQPMQNSMLIAVGVEYQPKNYVLRQGDEVSLFPPVQGG
jgi:molybdopterin converting factor small subunit